MFSENPGDRIDQLDAMRDGVDYRLQIEVRKFSILVRPLTIMETAKIAGRVLERVKGLPESMKTSLMENILLAKETLLLASTSDVDKTDSSLTEYIMDRMTPDELQSVHRQYIAVCDKVNPTLENLTDTQITELVDRIKKKDLHLTELSFLQMANVCRYLTKGD